MPACLVVVLATSWVVAQQGLPTGAGELVKFTIPERDARGVLIWQLMGDHAKLRTDGKMEVDKLTVSTFKSSGVDWTFTTPTCVFNRETREGVSESEVKMSNKNTEITGDGFHWLANESRFIIRSNVTVSIEGGISKSVLLTTPAGATNKSSTRICSNLLDFDYSTNRIASFEGKVVAVDPQLTLCCKTMKVFFADKNNEVLRVEAFADVHMFHEGKEGIGEKAVFTRETGLVMLMGSGPMLRDEKGNWMRSRGDGIIYDIGKKTMRVDKPTLEIQSGGMTNAVVSTAPKLWAGPPTPQPASKVVSQPAAPAPAPLAGTTSKPFTKIDSEVMDFVDYTTNRVATFEGNVVAEDPQLTLRCKTMKVIFSNNNNEVLRVEAYTDVHMLHAGSEAIGEKAVFTRESGIIVLSGPKPMLRDEKGNWIRSRGEGITYDTVKKLMHVDKPTSEILTGGGNDPMTPAR